MSKNPSSLTPAETLQLYNIAAVLSSSGDASSAYPIYLRLSSVNPPHSLSCHNLAVMHELGTPPVRKDVVSAIRLYGLAASTASLPQSQYSLACLLAELSGDGEETIELLTKAAEQGHVDAAFNLAVALETGGGEDDDDILEVDVKKAVEYYRQAAEGGHVKAAVNLGVLLRRLEVGSLPSPDFACSENGSRCLSRNCGGCSNASSASFLPPALPLSASSEASKWLRLAAAAGDSSAFFNLSLAVPTPEEASSLLEEAAKRGHVLSCYNLAKARIRAGDLQAAEELLNYAAEHGDEKASKDIRVVHKQIKEAEKRRALEEGQEAEETRTRLEAEAANRRAEEEDKRRLAEEELKRIKADDEAAHLARIQELMGATEDLQLPDRVEVKVGSKPTSVAIERAKAAKARRDAAAKEAEEKKGKGWVKLDGEEAART